ncbi:MAG: VWA domain-containing protein [Acidobacteria bacterium]|nr:VWA domain-containing protein [Acidobacteriota bacterium]
MSDGGRHDTRAAARGTTIRTAGTALALVLALLTSLHGSTQQSATPTPAPQDQQPDRPQFGARTELVLVDVSVNDRDGRPITDLNVEDFTLEVNGRPRTIASSQYVSTVPDTPTAATDASAPSSNDAPTSGRLLLFVIDDGHIRLGAAQAVVRTSEMLLSQLAPGDLVGVARLPSGIGSVEFTADRRRVREALARPAGSASGPNTGVQVQISEAFALETGDTETWNQALARECSGLSDVIMDSCASALETEAHTAITEAGTRAVQTLRYLDVLFSRLAKLNAPVNVVMITEGLFLGRTPTALAGVSRRAAEARVTLHIVRPANSLLMDASRQFVSGMNYGMDDFLMRDGLEQLAGVTRGRMVQVSAGTGAGIFERLNREMSGYYLLGFEPSDADRTGRQRRIRVQVRRKGISVRSRPTFALAREAAAAMAGTPATATGATAMRAPEEIVQDLLASPIPDRGLPMRVTTYNTSDAGDQRVRVIITAELGEPATEPAEWPTGVLILDKNDRVAAGVVNRRILAPATPRSASPLLLQTTVLLEPGEYTLRLAAADDSGRGGSVHHTIRAALTRTGARQEVSDLLVAPEPEMPEPARLMPAPLVDTESGSFQVSVTGQSSAQLSNTTVTLQIAESDASPPLTSVPLPLAVRESSLRTFAGLVRLNLLPPGSYVARAVVSTPGQPDTRVTRTFSYAPVEALPARPDTTASSDIAGPSVDEEVPPPPPPRIAVRRRGFDPTSVLTPKVVNAFLSSLETMYPPSAESAAVIARARDGEFDAPEPGKGAVPEDDAVLAFVRGLKEMEEKRYARAISWFQVVLQNASDFLGTAFYIGACHAASGRDHDAVGAWQMSLLSDASDVVYPPLIDGLIRIGDGLQALAFIDEAPDAWVDDDERDERQATAEAMTGAYVPALEKLHELIDRHGDDNDLLYLALQVMYRMRQENGSLPDADRERFADYAHRYTEAKGPQAPLVATWLRFVEKK